jgi:hypothetical protein
MKSQINDYCRRLTDLGAYVKDIKQGFTRYFNKRYGRRGFFWGDRFKSMIVQDVFDQVKHLLGSKDERKFTPVGGVDGVYPMKRLGT